MDEGDPVTRPPLGWPVRREDWYYINEAFVSATVTVYPGEIVGLSEKNYNKLAGLEWGEDLGEGDIVVVKYHQMATLLEKNGFVKL